jgi:glutaredoxin-related protein
VWYSSAQRSLPDPAAREYIAGVWGIRPEDLPQCGYSVQEIMNAIHAGEIKACYRCALILWFRCPMPTSRVKRYRNWRTFNDLITQSEL